MHFSRSTVIGAVMLSALPAWAQETTLDTVVATVNGVDITAGHMAVARERLPEQYRQLPDDVLYRGLLDQLVQQEALGKDITELTQLSNLTLENETRSLKAAEVIKEAVSTKVTEETIQNAYEADFASADPGKEFNAAHILVETEDEAKALVAQLDEGADFAELARENSTGPSGPNGGALGWFSEGMMVPEFEAAAVALEPGSYSAPVQTQFGWHVVLLNETRVKDTPALEDVRGEITAKLQEEAVADLLAVATEGSEVTRLTEIDIDPSFLSDPDFLDQ